MLPSGYEYTEALSSKQSIFVNNYRNEFINQIVKMTPVNYVYDSLAKHSRFVEERKRDAAYDDHRDRINYSFNKLGETKHYESPYFVMAHIVSPHPPFIFTPDGRMKDIKTGFTFGDGTHITQGSPDKVAEYKEDYIDQIQYINSRVLKAIDSIIAHAGGSNRSIVIVLQSDHGPGSELHWGGAERTNVRERMSILNAYYFSDKDYQQLYNTITPVNSFRVILNKYFGANYSLLEDSSYFSGWGTPFDFVDVTDKLK
ncbi:MAG: hypothetical protein BWY68_00819 [bacterium ADurb.Bin400]|nr:MAG: hypothetical protein BWY68_00819 [bacterium ADurb.Bin400]